MKKIGNEIQGAAIIILAFIGILMFGVNWELQRENHLIVSEREAEIAQSKDAMKTDHRIEVLELRNELNEARDSLSKAEWRIELLNKEREAE